MNSEEFLDAYKSVGFNLVEGWCGVNLFQVLDILDKAKINRDGGFLEIGVHHGKFYILVNGVIENRFKSFALDVFDNQSLNIDGSGSGNLTKFKENLLRFDRHGGANTEIIVGDSTDELVIKSLIDGGSRFRFISIDGGHTAEHTVSDLNLSSRLISNEGVVILDDIFNYHWPGVIEGAVNFLSQKPTLVPVAIGNNKLFFSKLSYRSFYFELFKNSNLKTKLVSFFGHQVVAI